MSTKPLRDRPAWKALETHHQKIERRAPPRACSRTIPAEASVSPPKAAGLFLDYSKNRITAGNARASCMQLAEESGLRERIDAMFRGEKINVTEDRAVLHVALRAPRGPIDSGRRQECRARGARRARADVELFRPGSAAATGRDTPAGGSATWSISASAAPTWGR